MSGESPKGTYKAAVVTEQHGKFEFVERPIPTPGPSQVLIKVQACGVCHSDRMAVHFAGWPGLQYPRVPGHEVIGTVAAVGDTVTWPAVGKLVGVGWHGSHCLFCEPCRKGEFDFCVNMQVCGLAMDGGYQEYMLAHWTGVAEIPEGMDAVTAAPLMCAGVTMFNSLRNQKHVHAGDLVAIQGIGGLGHLGVQFASKMGFQVAALSTSDGKKDLAMRLGAHHYLNVSKKPASEQLQALGGAKLILATAPDAKAMEDLVNGLTSDGRVVVIGADAATFSVSPFQLIPKRSGVTGWPSGIPTASTDTMRFAKLHQIGSMNEVFPFHKAQEAFDHMESGKPRFRVVLKMDD